MRLMQSITGLAPNWSANRNVTRLLVGLFLAFGTALSAVAQDVRPEVASLLREGHELFREGKLDEASAKFSEALLLDPTSDEAVDFIEDVNWAQIIKMSRSSNDELAASVGAIERLASTAVRDSSRDQAAIDALIDEYFSTGEMRQQQIKRFEMVNKHGVYVLPGLVDRLATNEAGPRTRAILAIRTLGVAATPGLNVALGSDDPRVVASLISAVNAIGASGCVPMLASIAEGHADASIREAAAASVKKIDPSAASKSAFDLLVSQAHDYYLDSSTTRTGDTEAIVWSLADGKLTYRDEPAWVINELRAEHLIGVAVAFAGDKDIDASPALELAAQNNIGQWVDYVAAVDIARRDGDASELEGMSSKYARIRNRGYAAAPGILLGALATTLEDDKPGVAVEVLEALTRGTVAGKRADSVPSVVDSALKYRDRGVRFGAAELIAKMNPRGDFASAPLVVDALKTGLVEAGGRVALTLFEDGEDARRAASILRGTNVAAFNEESGLRGLQRALGYPHDLIVLAPTTSELTSEEIITRLRKDYRTEKTPIYVFASDDASVTAFSQRLQSANLSGVTVLPISISADALSQQYLSPLFEGQTDARARSAGIAARAARSLEFLATRDSSFDLSTAHGALVEALTGRPDDVRIPVCGAIAALDVDVAENGLVAILKQEGQEADMTIAALSALGAISAGNGQVSDEVARVMRASLDSENIDIATCGANAIHEAGISPLINKDQ